MDDDIAGADHLREDARIVYRAVDELATSVVEDLLRDLLHFVLQGIHQHDPFEARADPRVGLDTLQQVDCNETSGARDHELHRLPPEAVTGLGRST